MVQETAIAEGTDVMWSDGANDSITDLQQAGANIDNLQQACTSTSGSGGTKKRRYIRNIKNKITKRKTKKNNGKKTRKKIRRKKRRSRKMRGGAECPLMPPIFTKLEEYIKDKQLKLKESEELDEKNLKEFIATLPIITDNEKTSINYRKMCTDLFKDGIHGKDQVSKSYQIGNINNRIPLNSSDDRLLFMNFKSHNIFNQKSREKLFNIINTTQPPYICLTEALVPTKIAENTEKSSIIQKLEDLSNDDIVLQPYNANKLFTTKKKEQHARESNENRNDGITIEDGIKKLTGKWIKDFITAGYRYIVFGNPTRCPYGKNWGNCIITKEKPGLAKIIHMTSFKKHDGSNKFVEKNDIESRCLIHITISGHDILCTHLEDKDDKVRAEQTKEIFCYINTNILLKTDDLPNTDDLPKTKKITLVGDLNAINRQSYNTREIQLLTKLNEGEKPLPFKTIDLLNELNIGLGIPLNTNQKYESLYQKCVSHAYSNMYTTSLMIFTDATEFDHQPLLLIKSNDKSDDKSDIFNGKIPEETGIVDNPPRSEYPPMKDAPPTRRLDKAVPLNKSDQLVPVNVDTAEKIVTPAVVETAVVDNATIKTAAADNAAAEAAKTAAALDNVVQGQANDQSNKPVKPESLLTTFLNLFSSKKQ